MVFSLSFEYTLLVFVGAVGVLQAAASYNNWQGLLFFFNRYLTYAFVALTAGGSLVVFFIWNYILPTGIVGGSEQAGLFALSTVIAIFLSLLVAGVIQYKRLNPQGKYPHGLDALKEATVFHIIRDILRSKNH